jgi:ketosteroid isomerase-like protein
MPGGNLDLVRSIYSEWERGDFSSFEWADPEIEFVVVGGLGGRERWSGVTGMGDGWGLVIDAFDDWRMTVEEYRELDDERALVLIRGTGYGKSSGARVNHRGGTLFHVRKGRVTRLVAYPQGEDVALADLGLAGL